MSRIICLCFFLFVVASNAGAAIGGTTILHAPPLDKNDARSQYYLDLLALALKKTSDDFGPFTLQPVNIKLRQSAAIKAVSKNQHIHVVWTMTSQQREAILLPIRIPLMKGMLGHRIFIVRQKAQHQYKNLTQQGLKQLRVGQGADWPDTIILRANRYKVTTSPSYTALFVMLKSKRFDIFPRGLHEPFSEVRHYGDGMLSVDPYNMLIYLSPIYFFVNPANTALAERIRAGLERASADGSFNKMFLNHRATREVFEKVDFQSRSLFYLNNPILPAQTPMDKQYWLETAHPLLKPLKPGSGQGRPQGIQQGMQPGTKEPE